MFPLLIRITGRVDKGILAQAQHTTVLETLTSDGSSLSVN